MDSFIKYGLYIIIFFLGMMLLSSISLVITSPQYAAVGYVMGAISILLGVYFLNVYNDYSKQDTQDSYQPASMYKLIPYKPQNEPQLPQHPPEPETRPRPIQIKPQTTQPSYENIGKIRNRTLKDLGWSEFFNYTYDDSVLGEMTKNEFHEIEMRLQYKKDQKEKEREMQKNKPQPSQQNIIPPQKPQKNNIIAQSKNYRNTTIDDIDKMEGTEFENFLKILFENMGYSAEITKHTTDMGADLILSKSSERISVQAKRWSANVGNDAIQAVVGSLKVYKTQRGIVVTNSDFTNPAIYQAHHCNVELWNREKLIDMINKYPVIK